MGYANIFWIKEKLIREYVEQNGQDDKLLHELGKSVLLLSKGSGKPLSFMDQGDSFYPFREFHSSDFSILLWTGQRFEILQDIEGNKFDFICSLQRDAGPMKMITSMPKNQRDIAVAGIGGWDNPLKTAGEYSIYYIYEDFTRNCTRGEDANKWPCKEVGAAVADLMFSNWNKSQSIMSHGNAISRVCTFLQSEMCFFVWAANCLRPLSNIGEDEIKKMKDYLSK